MKAYNPKERSIAFFERRASPAFWDAHWKMEDLATRVREVRSDALFIPAVKRYLPKQSRVLEGGCGRGQLVYALQQQGYTGVGIDFACRTVCTVARAVPEITVFAGDVRHLPFRDGTFDGYISAGVIEHFWEGYAGILSESARALRAGGYLFVSFPYMSPLRRFKAMVRAYESEYTKEVVEDFYQFALDRKRVISDSVSRGFSLVESKPFDGIKGFKDEIVLFRQHLQRIYDGKAHPTLRPLVDRLLRRFAAHMMLLVLRRE